MKSRSMKCRVALFALCWPLLPVTALSESGVESKVIESAEVVEKPEDLAISRAAYDREQLQLVESLKRQREVEREMRLRRERREIEDHATRYHAEQSGLIEELKLALEGEERRRFEAMAGRDDPADGTFWRREQLEQYGERAVVVRPAGMLTILYQNESTVQLHGTDRVVADLSLQVSDGEFLTGAGDLSALLRDRRGDFLLVQVREDEIVDSRIVSNARVRAVELHFGSERFYLINLWSNGHGLFLADVEEAGVRGRPRQYLQLRLSEIILETQPH